LRAPPEIGYVVRGFGLVTAAEFWWIEFTLDRYLNASVKRSCACGPFALGGAASEARAGARRDRVDACGGGVLGWRLFGCRPPASCIGRREVRIGRDADR